MFRNVRLGDRQAAKEVILDLIEAAGGTLHGATRLHKAFYLAHLIYWQNGEGVLTDYPIVRMPRGPGIDAYRGLIRELREDGKIEEGSQPVGPYPETFFKLTERRKLGKDPRGEAIKKAWSLVKKKTGKELSDFIHDQSEEWQKASDGEELSIYQDLVPDAEREAIRVSLGAFLKEVADPGCDAAPLQPHQL